MKICGRQERKPYHEERTETVDPIERKKVKKFLKTTVLNDDERVIALKKYVEKIKAVASINREAGKIEKAVGVE
jgi:hypothetical protein